MKRHILKLEQQYALPIVEGLKTFENRKNDRGFKIGDTLILRCIDEEGDFTGWEIECAVTYILKGGVHGLEAGFVTMSIEFLHYEIMPMI